MRCCFWLDIPPTTAATLTWGGGFLGGMGLISSLPSLSPFVFFFPGLVFWLFCEAASSSSREFRHSFRWDETCRASSRVGTSIRTWTGRRLRGWGRGCESNWLRIGKPYASVFPEPWGKWDIYAQNTNKTNCLCNTNDITILRGERENSSLDRCRCGEALLVQDM